MKYKNIDIKETKSGKYELSSPVNGTTRIFKTLNMAKNYIDNAVAIDSHAVAMRG